MVLEDTYISIGSSPHALGHWAFELDLTSPRSSKSPAPQSAGAERAGLKKKTPALVPGTQVALCLWVGATSKPGLPAQLSYQCNAGTLLRHTRSALTDHDRGSWKRKLICRSHGHGPAAALPGLWRGARVVHAPCTRAWAVVAMARLWLLGYQPTTQPQPHP